jgi:hypothetical protein
MKALLAILAVFFALALPAAAQDALAPGTEPAPEDPRTKVFVIGDSLAGGLGAGMRRLTEESERYNVQLRYQEDSGLTRPEFYDWPDAIAKIAASNKMDEAIVLIGSNDVRSIRVGGASFEFGTPEWTMAYTAQIDRLIASLKQTGAVLHWVSLPPMANPEYNQAIATIGEIQKQKAEEAGIHFIDLRPQLLNPDGTYMERGPDDTGTVRKIRDRDGVHFMKVGNNKIGALVLGAIMTRAEEAPKPEEAAPAQAEQPVAAQETGPIFGQAESDGIITIIRPASGLQAQAEGEAGPSTLSIAANSAAQQLFIKGQTPPPQPGRFDDFSFAEPAQPQP